MASFDTVNYSLRPSKTIQRHLVFEGVKNLQQEVNLENLVYIGFGSIWFADFVMAHKILGVRDMVSFEKDPIGYRRARYNAPFATVDVKNDLSTAGLRAMFDDNQYKNRPWFVWLDYDNELDEMVADDLRELVEKCPVNSVVLATIDGKEKHYGQLPRERPERLRSVLGDVVSDDLAKGQCTGDALQETIADLSLDFMMSIASDASRPGGFVPGFRIVYRDTAPMITIGGVLPAKGARPAVSGVVSNSEWRCRPERPIVAPNLTIREAAVLQSQLPRVGRLTRALVQDLGFDLDDDQIEAFERYYRQYPSFAQIVA